MCVPVMAAAKRMCAKSQWTISNLSIQKLLYIAHMFHLGETDTPLVPGNFEAWDYGPVHPDLYHELKMFGASPVKDIFRNTLDAPEKGSEVAWLDEVVDKLAHLPAGRLVSMTHHKNGAWSKRYKPGANILITNDDILLEFDHWMKNKNDETAAQSTA